MLAHGLGATDDAIGFVGLGMMGGAIARQLLRKGRALLVYDTSPAAIDRLLELCDPQAKVGRGRESVRVQAASSARAVADHCEIVTGCLPSSTASLSVAHALADGARIRHYIETSTIGLQTCQKNSTVLARHGISLTDAPVSGGPRGAADGTLASMVAAPADVLVITRPVISDYSARIFAVGETAGLAQVCKLVNNAISLSTLALVSEAAVVGAAAGLNPRVMIDAINASSGRSAVTEHKFPTSILTRQFDYGASIAIAEKDMQLFLQEARHRHAEVHGLEAAHQLWLEAVQAGMGEHDFTTLIQRFERAAGVVVDGRATPATFEDQNES